MRTSRAAAATGWWTPSSPGVIYAPLSIGFAIINPPVRTMSAFKCSRRTRRRSPCHNGARLHRRCWDLNETATQVLCATAPEFSATRASDTSAAAPVLASDRFTPEIRQVFGDLHRAVIRRLHAWVSPHLTIPRMLWGRGAMATGLRGNVFITLSVLRNELWHSPQDGQLGFIVSNAFTRRELGGPLVQDFFPIVDLQKVIDCSGLMFPGMVHHCVFYLVGTKSRSRSRPSALPQSFLGRATFARNPKRVMEHAFRS